MASQREPAVCLRPGSAPSRLVLRAKATAADNSDAMFPFPEPTPAGIALAAGLVVSGAPLFGSGLRVMRLRRQLRGMSERPLAELPTGLVLVRGRVTLDS